MKERAKQIYKHLKLLNTSSFLMQLHGQFDLVIVCVVLSSIYLLVYHLHYHHHHHNHYHHHHHHHHLVARPRAVHPMRHLGPRPGPQLVVAARCHEHGVLDGHAAPPPGLAEAGHTLHWDVQRLGTGVNI